MSDFIGLYDIRDGVQADQNLVISTFLKGLYYGDTWFSQIPKNIFMANYKLIAAAFFTSPKVIIKIACLKEDPNVILGYSILSSDYQTVHWVFVKSAWRNKGIGKSLVPKHPSSVTHLTPIGKTLLPKIAPAVFNPFLI